MTFIVLCKYLLILNVTAATRFKGVGKLMNAKINKCLEHSTGEQVN